MLAGLSLSLVILCYTECVVIALVFICPFLGSCYFLFDVPFIGTDWGIHYYCLRAPFGDFVMAFIFAIIQGPLMKSLLHVPSNHCIIIFVLLHHFSLYFSVNLDPLSDYVIHFYNFLLPIHVVRSCVSAVVINSFQFLVFSLMKAESRNINSSQTS